MKKRGHEFEREKGNIEEGLEGEMGKGNVIIL